MDAKQVLQQIGERVGGELLVSDEVVPVQKVNQSTGSKVIAWLPMLMPLLVAVGGGFVGLDWRVQIALGVTGLLVGGWLWNGSKERAARLQLALVEKAADPQAHTVAIEPPPAKAG